MTSIHSDFVQTSRLRIHFRTKGDPDGLPVLFLHGSFGSSRWWQPLMELLPDEILAVAPDLRGCGLSDKPDHGYTVTEQVEDVWQFTKALGWTDFDLVGHSTGGAIAIEFALHHMDTLHSLTLVNTAPIEGVYSPVETLRLLARMRDDTALLRQALTLLMPSFLSQDDSSGETQAFFDLLVADAAGMAPAAFTENARALSNWNRFEESSQLTLPTMLIWGDLDQIVDRDATERTLIALPGANNLEILHGVGHSPMIESPLAFAELLLDFITEDFAGYEDIRDQADWEGDLDGPPQTTDP